MSSGAPQLTRQDLYNVAICQKVILWCILASLIALILWFAVPETRLLLFLVFIPVSVLATVFVFMLALKVYNVAMGIVLGVLTLIPFPLIWLIALLIINQKATRLLNEHGYRVGLMGAKLSQFKGER